MRAEPTEPNLAASVDRDSIERAALARNPILKESAYRIRALSDEARSEGSLPAPEFMAELWQVPLRRPYAVDDAGMLMLSLRQHFPAAGSLDEKSRARAYEATAAAAVLQAQARALLREVDLAYADYVEAIEVVRARAEHLALLEQMKAVASARYAAGGPLADVTRTELEKARLEADLTMDRARIEEIKARLNGLMARTIGAPLGEPRVDEAMTVSSSAEELLASANQNSPEIQQARAMSQAASHYAESADAERAVPEFTVGLDYFHPIGGMVAGWGASFAMSLPWLWGEASNRSRGAEQRALAEAAAAETARLRVRTEALSALASVRGAEQRYLALRDGALPGAKKAFDITRAGYASGRSDLLVWLDSQRALRDVAVELAMARGALERALAELDVAVGHRVPRVPVGKFRSDAGKEIK